MSEDEEETDIESEGQWVGVEEMTEKQEEYLREVADEMGFKNLAGLAGWLATVGGEQWSYYDLIRASCRE